MKKGKGAKFERDICRQLSLWWTNGERDDVFWRTSGSGAMATSRRKKQKRTFGQYGDVQATDPVGQPLLDVCTIELKRGYASETFANLLETHQNPKAKPPLYKRFIEQAITDSQITEDGKEWILIVKRDRREAVLFTPSRFIHNLRDIYTTSKTITHCVLRIKINRKWQYIRVLRLSDFLSIIKPKDFKRYYDNR